MQHEIASSLVRLTIVLFVLFNTLWAYSFLERDNKVSNIRRNHVDYLSTKQFVTADPKLKSIVREENHLNKEDDLDLPFETNEVKPKSTKEKVPYQKRNEIAETEWSIVPDAKRKQRVTRQISQGYPPLYPQLPTSQPYGQYPPYATQPNQSPFGQNPQGYHYPTYNSTHGSNPSFNPTYQRQPQSGQYPSYNSSQYPSYNPTGHRPPFGGPQTPGYGTQYPSYNSSHSGPHHSQYPSYTTSSTSYPIYNPASQTPPYNQYPSYNYTRPTNPTFIPTQRPGSSIPTGHYQSPNASHGYYPPYNPTSQRPPYSPPSAQFPTYNPSQQRPGNWQSPSYNSSHSSYPPYNAQNTPNSNPPYNPNPYNPMGQKQPYDQTPSRYPAYNTNHLSYPGHAVGTLPNNYTNPYVRY